MTDLNYHFDSENRSGKNYLTLSVVSISQRKLSKEGVFSLTSTAGEKSAWELLFKEQAKLSLSSTIERMFVSADRSFELLKLLGTTGRLFYRSKKVIVDPFSCLEIYFEAEKKDPAGAQFIGCWALNHVRGRLSDCEGVFPADPSWVLKDGVIRAIKEEIPTKWIRLAAAGLQCLEGPQLAQFLTQAEGEIRIDWKTEQTSASADPYPFLVLADRHGGFADLWFDYGSFGKIAAHDPTKAAFRNAEAEKGWEKDLLETDFSKKVVERSHYYCPLDKVAKSLTFLLEIGWGIIDNNGRKVLRQKHVDFGAALSQDTITVRAKVHYQDHEADVKDLIGAFNRRERFVELSANSVALIDPDEFAEQFGDFTEEEVTSEGIKLKPNRCGLLQSLFEQQKLPLKGDVVDKLAKLSRCEPLELAHVGKDFRGELFPYQQQGLQWLKFLSEGGFGGLLADEMGLGKTVQVLAFFSQLLVQKPLLIVMPTSLVFNWQREIEKFLPLSRVYRHDGKERLASKEELQQQHIILTSYAILRLDGQLLQEVDFYAVILDEAQAIKNPDSQISQLCCRLRCQMALAITGTPIENRLDDLWAIFRFLQPDLLGERKAFQAELQAAQLHAQYFAKMKKKIRPFLLRRKKDQVALELPLKLEQTVLVEMTELQRQIYERWLQGTKQGLLKKVSLDGAASHRMEILEAILRLRQLCAHPWLVEERQEGDMHEMSAKFERLLSDLGEVVEEGRKVLVYSQFTSMLKLIEAAVKEQGWGYVYLDGSTKNREETVLRFQEDPQVAIFLISLKAGGVGLNLTAADYVFLYDPWWNEAVERQAIDRAHRVGKRGTVIARRYVTALSIEEKIMRLKEHKAALSQHVLDFDESFGPASLDDLLALLT